MKQGYLGYFENNLAYMSNLGDILGTNLDIFNAEGSNWFFCYPEIER